MTFLQSFVLLAGFIFAVTGAVTFEIVGEEIGRYDSAPWIARLAGTVLLAIAGASFFIGGSL